MSREALREVIRPLPWSLREQVEEYVRSVVEAAPNIFEEAGVAMNRRALDDFVFIVGIRKLWHLVDSQYILLTGALTLVEGHGVGEIRVGRGRYGRNSETYAALRQLRNALYRELIRLEIFNLANTRSLTDVAKLVGESRGPA
jgi:hypothetical protein